MENDALKSAWKGTPGQHKDHETIKFMMQERNHPVLKRMRLQLIIEIAAFAVFLLVYDDFFDGGRKPVYVHVLLVVAVLLVIAHNVWGYVLAKHPVNGGNLIQSLQRHVAKLKGYAVVSVASRTLIVGSVLLFFMSTVVLGGDKYWILLGIVLIVVIQLVLLSRIWANRIERIKKTLDDFSG
jgi:hypothetical protein